MTGMPCWIASSMTGAIALASITETAIPSTLAATAVLNSFTCSLLSAGLGACQSALHFNCPLAASSPLPIESQKGEIPLVITLYVPAPAGGAVGGCWPAEVAGPDVPGWPFAAGWFLLGSQPASAAAATIAAMPPSRQYRGFIVAIAPFIDYLGTLTKCRGRSIIPAGCGQLFASAGGISCVSGPGYDSAAARA